MKNLEVYRAIREGVDKVGWAMYWPMAAAGLEPVYWAVYQDVDRAVYRGMGRSLELADRRDSFHPGLNFYLKVGGNGDEQ